MALKKVWDKLRGDDQVESATAEGTVIKAEPGDVSVDPLVMKAEVAIEPSPSGLGTSFDSNTPSVSTNVSEVKTELTRNEMAFSDNSCDNSWKLNQTPAYFEVAPTVEGLPETSVAEKILMPLPPLTSVPTRRHFKRRLSLEKTKKDSIFSELQAVAISQNISEKIQNEILKENLEMVREERLFLESQREELVAFERAQREIELDILMLERKMKEEILKRIESGSECFCSCPCLIIPPPDDNEICID